MFYLLGFVLIAWLISRESYVKCDLCGCKRKVKHIETGFMGHNFCEISCEHVAFITGKPVMKNGQIEVEYNWEKE